MFHEEGHLACPFVGTRSLLWMIRVLILGATDKGILSVPDWEPVGTSVSILFPVRVSLETFFWFPSYA